jgi:uroporphyrin-III C-methyltransferase/precorrin-2 dehydrogenase/sirohydrochlorin ferrochelatase
LVAQRREPPDAHVERERFAPGGEIRIVELRELLVEHARRGEYVVRLKGGDPFVFGRGGEEIDHLRVHGVSFEVIPGITAAIAAGAYAGVPLTDRRHAQAVRFLTGNSDEQLAQFNYSDLAAGRETLAFYMSVGRLAPLRDQLLAAGVAGDLPVAFIENASRHQQRMVASTVEHMHRDAVMQKIKAPSMLIVGNVARRAAELQWFGRWAGASAT